MEDLLGLDDDDEEAEDGEDISDGDSEGNMDDTDFLEFKRRTRVDETQRTEENRRPGGIKTQHAVVKAWTVRFKMSYSLICTDHLSLGIC